MCVFLPFSQQISSFYPRYRAAQAIPHFAAGGFRGGATHQGPAAKFKLKTKQMKGGFNLIKIEKSRHI